MFYITEKIKYILTLPERKLVALYKVLDYIYNKVQQMNVDVTFGITLTEGKKYL